MLTVESKSIRCYGIKKQLILCFRSIPKMKAQERARNLLARRRQQLENRKASMLGRSGQEILRPESSVTELQ
jgi:hypothetical protein